MKLLYDSYMNSLLAEAFLNKATCPPAAATLPNRSEQTQRAVRRTASRGKPREGFSWEFPAWPGFGVNQAQNVADDLFQRDVNGASGVTADLFLREA